MSQAGPFPQYVHAPQPPYVVVQAPSRNGLGIFGFLLALVGLFIPTGIVSFLGLAFSLVAVGRAPRGWAATGVVLGLLGTVFWLVVMAAVLVMGLVGLLAVAVAAAGAFLLTQPETVELTSDMVNVAITAEHYRKQENRPPASLDELELSAAVRTDPWGQPYRLQLPATEAEDLDLISSGPDGVFGTDDDVSLQRLDRLWEGALASFETRMNELATRLESLDETERCGWAPPGYRGYGTRYEALAREASLGGDAAR